MPIAARDPSSLHLVPFADRLLVVHRGRARTAGQRRGSALLLHSIPRQRPTFFLAMLFLGAVHTTGLLEMLAGSNVNVDIFNFGQQYHPNTHLGLCDEDGSGTLLLASTVCLRSKAMPRWVSYLGYLVALILLLAAGEHRWTQLVFPAWVLLVSVVFLFSRPVSRRADVA